MRRELTVSDGDFGAGVGFCGDDLVADLCRASKDACAAIIAVWDQSLQMLEEAAKVEEGDFDKIREDTRAHVENIVGEASSMLR